MKISQINCGFNVQFRRLHMSYRQRWPIFVMFFIHSIVFCEIFIQNVIHSIIMKFHSFLENIHFIIFGFHSIQKKYSCFKKGPYSIQNFIQFNENLCHSFKKIIHLFEKSVIEHPYRRVGRGTSQASAHWGVPISDKLGCARSLNCLNVPEQWTPHCIRILPRGGMHCNPTLPRGGMH